MNRARGEADADRTAPPGGARGSTRRLALGVALWAALVAGLGLAVEALVGVEVTILSRRFTERETREARGYLDARDDPAEAYGIVEGRPLRVLFPDATRVIVPPEAGGRRLLHVDRLHGEAPALASQARLAGWVLGGALGATALGIAAVGLRRRRRARPRPPREERGSPPPDPLPPP